MLTDAACGGFIRRRAVFSISSFEYDSERRIQFLRLAPGTAESFRKIFARRALRRAILVTISVLADILSLRIAGWQNANVINLARSSAPRRG